MTHKIKVQMFGNFRMDYNGAPFVAEKMHKESQFNRMMQALIHYSDYKPVVSLMFSNIFLSYSSQ